MSRAEANRNREFDDWCGDRGASGVVGPGLLESAYETCLQYELSRPGIRVETQVPQPVIYKGINSHYFGEIAPCQRPGNDR